MEHPRKQLQRREVPGQSRYLTCSCYHRLPLFAHDAIKQVFVDRLVAVQSERSFRLAAWVLMPEHVHLLVEPEPTDCDVPRLLHALKRPIAERVLRRWRELDAPILSRITDGAGIARFWQAGGGYDRNVYSRKELAEKVRYMHNNPVVRGLAPRPEAWPWSSARWFHGDRTGPVIDRLA